MNNEIRCVKPDKLYSDFTDAQEKIDFPPHKETNTYDDIMLIIICYQSLEPDSHQRLDSQ